MKAIHIMLVLLLLSAASAAYVMLHRHPPTIVESEPRAELPTLVTTQITVYAVSPRTNPPVPDAKPPVQPLEERGDAMLFEIEVLQNTPFDDAVTRPFD